MSALVVSHLLLWLAVIVLAALVFALARQIGVLHERVAPAGALLLRGGPAVGEPAPAWAGADLFGRPIRLGGASDDGRGTLLLFVAPGCPVCTSLVPVVRRLAAEEAARLRIVFASDGEPATQRRFAEQHGLGAFPYVVSAEVGLSHGVGRLPHAVLIDAAGIVRAKGLVNSREHLESLLVAQAHGVASIQDFVASSREPARTGEGRR
ncbi:MAG TPA: methylamine dehydrogenase accessory protein MauD [Myxococcota bacterium]|nr:methylamine dehydrogenase accessory protein MauD [Myxococcota bacterium]